MIVITVFLCLALLVFLAAFYLLMGLPDFRSSAAKPAKLTFAGGLVCLLLALATIGWIRVQDNTNIPLRLSGGVQYDAEQWINRNSPAAPVLGQAGDNIRILREGLTFLRRNVELMKKPDIQTVVSQYSKLPERPTKLLTRDEERQYYEGALAVRQVILGLSGTSQ